MSIKHHAALFIELLFVKSRRLSRLTYILSLVLYLLVVFTMYDLNLYMTGNIFFPIETIPLCIGLYMLFIINLKRANDIEKGWLLALWATIPVLNIPAIIYLLLTPGTYGPNEHGDDPILRTDYNDLNKEILLLSCIFLILPFLTPRSNKTKIINKTNQIIQAKSYPAWAIFKIAPLLSVSLPGQRYEFMRETLKEEMFNPCKLSKEECITQSNAKLKEAWNKSFSK